MLIQLLFISIESPTIKIKNIEVRGIHKLINKKL